MGLYTHLIKYRCSF